MSLKRANLPKRPKRKGIPVATKKLVVDRQGGICLCGCGRAVEWKNHRATTRFDHFPALNLRPLNGDGTDYEPAQLDHRYIDARCLDSDERRRSGGPARATTAGTDVNAMAKQRKRDRKPKMKRAWAKGRKLQSRGFEQSRKGKGGWWKPAAKVHKIR